MSIRISVSRSFLRRVESESWRQQADTRFEGLKKELAILSEDVSTVRYRAAVFESTDEFLVLLACVQ